MADPLSEVYAEFWDQLETVSDLTDLVKAGNRLKFDKRNAIKMNLSTIDVPELRVVVVGGEPKPRASNLRGWTETYEIGVVTGDQRLEDVFFPLRWALIKAVHAVETGLILLDLSAYDGTVVSVNPQSVRDGVSAADEARGIDGWMTFWTVDVVMKFAPSSLE